MKVIANSNHAAPDEMVRISRDRAPGVGTPVRGGATYREAHLAMEILADHGRLLSFEMVEVNPVITNTTGLRIWRLSWRVLHLERRFSNNESGCPVQVLLGREGALHLHGNGCPTLAAFLFFVARVGDPVSQLANVA